MARWNCEHEAAEWLDVEAQSKSHSLFYHFHQRKIDENVDPIRIIWNENTLEDCILAALTLHALRIS